MRRIAAKGEERWEREAEVFPECRIAYNLDGGGSTHLIINGKHVHQTPSSRFISDLIYFASIAPEK